jgi:hypothetical protein
MKHNSRDTSASYLCTLDDTGMRDVTELLSRNWLMIFPVGGQLLAKQCSFLCASNKWAAVGEAVHGRYWCAVSERI